MSDIMPEGMTSCKRVWRHARGSDITWCWMDAGRTFSNSTLLDILKRFKSYHYNLNSLVFPMLFIPTSGILYRKVSLYSTSMLLTNYEALISFHIPFRCYHIFNTCDLNKTKYIKMLTNTLKTMSDVNFMEIYLFLYI